MHLDGGADDGLRDLVDRHPWIVGPNSPQRRGGAEVSHLLAEALEALLPHLGQSHARSVARPLHYCRGSHYAAATPAIVRHRFLISQCDQTLHSVRAEVQHAEYAAHIRPRAID